MKTRVIRKGSIYYPQYKGLLFWNHFAGYDMVALDGKHFVKISFGNCNDAVKYIKNVIQKDIVKVVWESDTEGHNMTLEEISDLFMETERISRQHIKIVLS
jgi:hypothetical protein